MVCLFWTVAVRMRSAIHLAWTLVTEIFSGDWHCPTYPTLDISRKGRKGGDGAWDRIQSVVIQLSVLAQEEGAGIWHWHFLLWWANREFKEIHLPTAPFFLDATWNGNWLCAPSRMQMLMRLFLMQPSILVGMEAGQWESNCSTIWERRWSRGRNGGDWEVPIANR